MKVRGGNAARSLFAAAILGFLAFMLLVQYAPDSVAFSPNNYGWNGLQGVATTYSVNFTTSLSSVSPRAVLVISQPSINFSSADIAAVRSHLTSGGTVLVADKSGVANSLLTKVGSSILVQSQYTVDDRTYNWKSSGVPTALVLPSAKASFRFLANVTGIALNQPSPLDVSGKASDLAITSQFSTYIDSSGRTVKGPFVVMAAQRFGNGTLIVVGDSQFLLNSEWTIANNKILIGNLFANAGVYIDASHWGVSSIAQLKSELGQFYSFVSSSPLRYIATLFVIGAGLALVPTRVESASPTPFNEHRKGANE